MITHSGESYQPTSIIRWDKGKILMAHLNLQDLPWIRCRLCFIFPMQDPRGIVFGNMFFGGGSESKSKPGKIHVDLSMYGDTMRFYQHLGLKTSEK